MGINSSKVDINWKIGGEAGWGIKSTGLVLSKTFVRGGYHVFSYDEYPSLVRGGHNCYQARISDEKIYSQVKSVDILVALNQETFDLHHNELRTGATIIYDGTHFTLNEKAHPQLKFANVPLREITKKQGAPEVTMNNAALGATIALLGFDFKILAKVISDQFSEKGEEVVNHNLNVAQAGFDYVEQNYHHLCSITIVPRQSTDNLLLTGNEAIALGALAGGLKFFPAYPMTPASSILHSLAAWANSHNLVVVQTEDEISAINMALGGAYAGVRTMTATSGGGFSLMVEGLGLSGMTETPLVVVIAQRPGPATGLPTWTEQGDLRFVLHAHQGYFPRVVIAPSNLEEAFYVTADALNIAEKYQLPVLVLSDKLLSESHATTDPFDAQTISINRGKIISAKSELGKDSYQRYAFTEDGISPRAFPGQPGITVRTNSDEHDPQGFSIEDSRTRNKMMEKRQLKLKVLESELPQPKVYGDENAEVTLVGWGTTKGAILEAQKILTAEGISSNFLHFLYIHPLPERTITETLGKAKNILSVENNFDAALTGLITEKTGIAIKNKLLKYDGRPFYPSEIVKKVKEIL